MKNVCIRRRRITPARKKISDLANEVLDQLLACESTYQSGEDLAEMKRGALAVVFADF
jgi:hypothetical protein